MLFRLPLWGARAAMWNIRTVSPKSNPPNMLSAVWLNPGQQHAGSSMSPSAARGAPQKGARPNTRLTVCAPATSGCSSIDFGSPPWLPSNANKRSQIANPGWLLSEESRPSRTGLNQLQEPPVHSTILGQLRMKRRRHDVGFPHEHGLAAVLS